MNRSIITAGIFITAGLSTLFGATTAQAATTPHVYASHGAIYLNHNGHTTRLTSDDVSSQPTLSPNGTQIAYVHNNTIWVMHTDGSNQHQISDRTGSTPTWTTDSSRITYTAVSCTGAPGTYRTHPQGGQTSEVITPAACLDQTAPEMGYITG